MAKVDDKVMVNAPLDAVWELATDLERFPDWLVSHDGWRSELPKREDFAVGMRATLVAVTKGQRVKMDWVCEEYDPKRRIKLSGKGVVPMTVKTTISMRPAGERTEVELRVDLSGKAMFGPVGFATAKLIGGDLRQSLGNFQRLLEAEAAAQGEAAG